MLLVVIDPSQVFWSQHLTTNFEFFVACAVLLSSRDIIMAANMEFDQILQA
jgi:hypothetical protein